MKLVKEILYEKFAKDSDPIQDMGIGLQKIIDNCIKNIYKFDYEQILLKNSAANKQFYFGNDHNNIRYIRVRDGNFEMGFYSDWFYNLKHEKIIKTEYALELFKKANIDQFFEKTIYKPFRNNFELLFKIKPEYIKYFKEGDYNKHDANK